jgi:hypothetical protein
MLLLPVEHSAPGSLDESHRVIAMTMCCQLDSLMFDAGEVSTPSGLPCEKVIDIARVLSVNAGVNISASTCLLLLVK